MRATPAVAEARAAIARRADAILDALYSNTNDTERSLALVAACRKRETSVYKDVRRSRSTTAFPDLGELVERLNLRHVYYWLGLAGAVGLIGGLGALAFKAILDLVIGFAWPTIISFVPGTPGGEPNDLVASGPLMPIGLIVAPMVGGFLSAFLVYRFAPEAEGHGTDAAIRAFHRDEGRMRWRVPIIKLFASAFTLGAGGSAGREGPIAQIGAGFGSALATVLRLPVRERRVLLAAGVAAGIGAIFRAPLAGAVFAAEVLYREPDLEAEVVLPALLAAIVSYSVYCAVHGFGHLFTGTTGFAFHDPRALLGYGLLGITLPLVGIVYVSTLSRMTTWFHDWKVTNYIKPAIGGALVGGIGLAGYLSLRDTAVLAVMGSGYGTLQLEVSAGSVGPALSVLAFVAFGKIVTTSLTIGSGGSGGVFGPSMVIGGSVGAVIGTVLHAWWPEVVPNIGPFTIVGMAGFFAGVAKTPISTLLMVGELTGNYELLIPSMLVVCLAMIIAHGWTIYSEQVPTRAMSPAHRDELSLDVLADLTVGAVIDRAAAIPVLQASTPAREVLRIADDTGQHTFPIIDPAHRLVGVLSVDLARTVVAADPAPGLVVAGDLATPNAPELHLDDPLARALELFGQDRVEILPVVDGERTLVGLLDRRAVLGAYHRRVSELRARLSEGANREGQG